MDTYYSGTCLNCGHTKTAVHSVWQWCARCLCDNRVLISGEGNQVVVSGSDLTVYSAGRRVIAAEPSRTHPAAEMPSPVAPVPTSAEEAVRIAYGILYPLPISSRTDAAANHALSEMQRARIVLLEWLAKR